MSGVFRQPLFGVLLCVLWTTSALADTPASFAWRQPIRDGVEAGQLYRIRVAPEVFDGCRAFPSDLRILDQATNQWPYFVWAPAPAEEIDPLRVRLLNKSVDEGPDRFLRVDLEVDASRRGSERPQHDRITVNTGGSQYIRRVEVYGSDDGSGWKRMASGYLIDQKREVQVTSRTILYPVSDYPRMQVRIYPNASNAEEEINLLGITVAATVRKDGETDRIEMKMVDAPPPPPRAGVKAAVLDQGVEGRPLARLRIETGGEFTRAVRVSGRNDPTNGWRWVAEGSVFRFGDQARDTIDLNDATYRYYLLEEYHYDDAPLRIDRVTAEAVPRYIVFEAGAGKEPELYYGSAQASVPRYDLQRRTKEERIRAAKQVDLGRPEPLQAPAEALPYGRWLAVLGVGAASLVVVLVVVRMVRRQTGT